MKKCAKCDSDFSPTASFGRDYSYCKKCVSIKRKTDWANNKEHIAKLNRASHIKKKYGVTQEDLEVLMKNQDGRCAICKTDKGTRKSWKSLAIDHDHETGKVRGLLCQICNTVLGMFNDDPKLFESSISYLDRHKKES